MKELLKVMNYAMMSFGVYGIIVLIQTFLPGIPQNTKVILLFFLVYFWIRFVWIMPEREVK